ncbi:hypothetical protein ACHAQA_006325 [Verticillium albo-atrum]
MITTRFAGLFLASLVAAAPFMSERDLNATVWTPDHELQPDEVIIYGNGRMEVIHENTWLALLESEGISTETPEIDHAFLEARDLDTSEPEGHVLQSRQCASTTSFVTDRTQRFIDWDVQMSPVVLGVGNGLTVAVASSYSVSNSVAVSAGLDIKFIKDRLGGSLGINYSRTWTTQASITLSGVVRDGEAGVWITKPWTNRRYGRTFQGCVGSMRQTGTFMADSHEEGSYEGVKWISGGISMCLKKQRSLPLTRCSGSGAFR